jgi:cytochrome d ubiquinol oxidase subunit I
VDALDRSRWEFGVTNVVIGVVTEIVKEFPFGVNRSTYTRMVGNILGPPLSIGATLAFFLKLSFLGLRVFGWELLSPRLRVAHR